MSDNISLEVAWKGKYLRTAIYEGARDMFFAIMMNTMPGFMDSPSITLGLGLGAEVL